MGASGTLEGWMDDDAASAAGQLFGNGPCGVLVIDARELLSSTARVVGAALGELHFKAWMALITLHVVHGMPHDGRASTTLGELARLVWGGRRERSGKDTFALLDVMHDLRDAKFTVPGYDLVNQRPAAGVSDTSLLINLYIDDTILRGYIAEKARRALAKRRRELAATQRNGAMTAAQLERGSPPSSARPPRSSVSSARTSASSWAARGRGTLAWRMHPDYTQRLGEAELRRFDWTKAQAMRGVALTLWMGFTSPRMPYRPLFDAPRDLELVEIPLTVEHCHAPRRTLSHGRGAAAHVQ